MSMLDVSPLLQIEPIDIDFGRLNFQHGERSTYPPSFTIAIDGRHAIRDSFVTFRFKGTLPTDLVLKVPLTYGSVHQLLGKSK